MNAIILAAGKGTRLSKYTKGMPKCLLPLGNETILSREIRMLEDSGISQEHIYVVGGYHSELIEPLAPNFIYNSQYETKENGYSLGIALEKLFEDDVLILDADLCFDREILKAVIENTHGNVVTTRKGLDTGESTGVRTDVSGRVTAIGKQYLNTGYIYLSILKVDVKTIPDLREKLLVEENGKTWYTQAITDICQEQYFYNLVTMQKWHEIDSVNDYLDTLKLFQIEAR